MSTERSQSELIVDVEARMAGRPAMLSIDMHKEDERTYRKEKEPCSSSAEL